MHILFLFEYYILYKYLTGLKDRKMFFQIDEPEPQENYDEGNRNIFF